MSLRVPRTLSTALAAGVVALGAACESDEPRPLEPFTLRFAAVYNGAIVGCGNTMTGLSTTQTATAELSDLRFYVSNIRFYNDAGAELPVRVDSNAFQFRDATGYVALIDLTGTGAGACAGVGLSYPEGTARTNAVITGMTYPEEIHRMSFDVGIPQALMKEVLAQHTDADAPSPLAEMHWSWAYAYRHYVMNFTLADSSVAGEGYLHIGSTDCGGDGTRAMTDRTTCGKVNTPTVAFDHFHIDDTVAVDIGAALANVDFRVEQSGPGSALVPGVATHSSPNQPDTDPIFSNFGITVATGVASATANTVFKVK